MATIDLSSGNEVFDLAMTANVGGWSILPLPAAGKVAEIRVLVQQHASAAKSCASPATAGKTAGGAWVISSILGSTESLALAIRSDGTVSVFPAGVNG
ncbi:hypothetical protein N789_14275 [Arenimonas oryziterrae DSM 21050 = YC6267]|uniref:Uncharacterized protein n=1 Tax=Arenimonas oryziterrae DSM 21050 = YC6267 TaxID=1121015 RepID=A0A091AT62_9GAMM|nr:hypothetical protein N789_14275 [Arenimonas oryziterrae DSM 21050 = YC6267]